MFLLNTKEIVKKILLTPIECNKRYKTIKLVNGEICSPQKYYCGEDCDMSDFAVGFYEIIYANIIPGKKILNNGFFTSKEFAGDTMNSFNSLANIILDNNDKNSRSSKDIWPDYLEKYEKDYRHFRLHGCGRRIGWSFSGAAACFRAANGYRSAVFTAILCAGYSSVCGA